MTSFQLRELINAEFIIANLRKTKKLIPH